MIKYHESKISQVLLMLVSLLVLHHSLTSMILKNVLELQQRACDTASTLISLLSPSKFTPPTRNPHIAYQHPTHVTPTHIYIHPHIYPCSTYSPLFLLLTVCLSSDYHVIQCTSSWVGTDVTAYTLTVGNKVCDEGVKNKVKQQQIFHVWNAQELQALDRMLTCTKHSLCVRSFYSRFT